MQLSLVLILVTCELCAGIRVPSSWDDSDSEVKQEEFAADTFNPVNIPSKPVPVEYFEYKAKKPQFAVEVASFHGVQSPENHYTAYPIKPHTGRLRPELGKHKIINSGNTLYDNLQEFANINEDQGHTEPASDYGVFHPYEAEVPALQELYKDPILNKIRGDLENSKNRLQKYEKEAGEPNIKKGEYLENPHKTGNRLVPHRNVPVPFEIHRPQRRPVYYRHGPRYNPRDQYLNQRLRHPWNQYVKVRPAHYQPLKNHIHHLRQNHALKYDDERNEYPQVQILENLSSDPKDGYDIYEKGKDKYVQLRNNVDESINQAVKENRPTTYQKLEIQNNDSSDTEENDEDEFVPIKNYAQVRKTETFRHLPRSAALKEAETFDEIRNAPRLREAVKSTKAQTVYSEEGYEDAAYDHAGEQKHAEENEGHGGFLKQNELSGGKYKTPSESGNFDDHHGSVYRDKLVDNKKWKKDNKEEEQEIDEEDYSEDEHEQLLEATNHQEKDDPDENNSRNKRENQNEIVTELLKENKTSEVSQHELNKRETKFEVPLIDFNSTYLNEKDILKLAKIKATPNKDELKSKYPYYFKNIRSLSKDSPLRYAENLKLIPKKSKGGTEFYDSRASLKCPEIDDVPDPIPAKLRSGENPDNDDEDNSSKGEENFDTTKKQPRLKGLGDKIDCFKAKYFGENPLDSPFFKEDLIRNPEPVRIPNIAAYKLINSPFTVGLKELNTSESKISSVFDNPLQLINGNLTNLFNLIEKLRNDNQTFSNDFLSNVKMFSSALETPKNLTDELEQTNVYSDIIKNIKDKVHVPISTNNSNIIRLLSTQTPTSDKNITYSSFHNIEDITKPTLTVRKKRAAPFTYEPYKIIRDTPVQDSKKTTTTSNISPLIKQLQSSRIVERVSKSTPESISSDIPVKHNINSRVYKDIGRNDRKYTESKNDKPAESAIVDVNIDKRRGEPRYEVRHSNHKSSYTPVENKKAMTLDDYKSQTNRNNEDVPTQRPSRQKNSTRKPYFDVSKFLPKIAEVQNTAASNAVRKTVQSTTEASKLSEDDTNSHKNDDDEEDYDEYEDDEEDDVTTTTTTVKPAFRRRTPITSTTEVIPDTTETPRLRLVTRFRDYNPETPTQNKAPVTEKTVTRFQTHKEEVEPQYREKKKKLTKSTLVTDTKKYGDDHDNDMRKEEVDAMIGVKQDIEDYMPLYEKENLSKTTSNAKSEDHNNDKGNEQDDNDDEEERSDADDDYYSDEDDDDDEDRINDDDDDEDDEDSEEEEDESTEDHDKKTNDPRLTVTTSEPTKRTLAKTTDAPIPTSPVRLAQLKEKPLITRKKIEIHKELPVNKSLPHVTQYKQDIKEVEIIKEIPRRRKPIKNAESLELYKDDKLAEEINKLGDVEVFRENLNLRTGPKHGGNYKSLSTTTATPSLKQKPKSDTEASQTKYTKEIRQDSPQKIRINLKARSNGAKSEKLIELVEPTQVAMHGGNLRHRDRVKNDNKSEKLIELDEDNHEYSSSQDSQEDNPYDSRRERPRHGLHGGNYRSANLMLEPKEISEATKKVDAKEARRKGAVLLNSFAQAVPIMTTTPSFILDPSKRMYYYVDT